MKFRVPVEKLAYSDLMSASNSCVHSDISKETSEDHPTLLSNWATLLIRAILIKGEFLSKNPLFILDLRFYTPKLRRS